MHAEGELERAKTNIMVYMKQSVGIGEHSDIVEAIQEELDKMAAATDRIDMLDIHFKDEDNDIEQEFSSYLNYLRVYPQLNQIFLN